MQRTPSDVGWGEPITAYRAVDQTIFDRCAHHCVGGDFPVPALVSEGTPGLEKEAIREMVRYVAQFMKHYFTRKRSRIGESI